MSETAGLPALVVATVEAARSKKALDVKVLDLQELTAFTDYFLMMSGNSIRQTQAIADAVVRRLKEEGQRPSHREGYAKGEWILLDYSDFVVHVFSPQKREFYDLERLWSDAVEVEVPEAAA